MGLSRRTDAPVDTVVRKYGLRAPVDWDDACEDQIRKQGDFWNALVALAEQHSAKFEALTAEVPEVAALQARLVPVRERLEEMIERRKRLKVSGQTEPDLPALITATRAERKALADDLKEARRKARSEKKPEIDALRADWFAAAKAARQAAAAGGLWWCHYNAVADSFDRARASMLKARASGQAAELRRRHYGADARLTNQIQGGISPAVLFAGTHPQVKIVLQEPRQLRPERHERPRQPGSRRDRDDVRYAMLTATVYSTGRGGERRTVTWPIKLHRPIPDDVTIKEVVITRRRVAHKAVWHAVFTCTRAAAERPPIVGAPAAVDLGWRRLSDGLRVATVLRAEAGAPEFVTLPEAIIDIATYIDALRGKRDQTANEMLAWLRTLPWDGAPEPLRDYWTAMSRAPAIGPRALARLCFAWRDQGGGCKDHDYRQAWRPEDIERLDRWRGTDKKQREAEQEHRIRLEGRRRELYHIAARRILDGASMVVFDRLDLHSSARLPKDGSTPKLPDMARRYRQLACVHDLRQWVVNRAKEAGVPVVEHVGTSRTCWHCGTARADDDPRGADLMYTCRGCGRSYDQDVNDCRHMLRERSGGDADTASAREPKAA